MSRNDARIPPLPPAEWTADVREMFTIMDGPKAREEGSTSNLILTLANHPALASAYLTFGKQVLYASTLPHRLREIATLRVAWRYQAEYEWGHHVVMARRIGVSDAEIEALKDGPEAGIWCRLERHVILAADELCETSRVSDETWHYLARHLDRRQLMDLVFTVGNYTLLAWVMNTLGIRIEANGEDL